MESLVSLPDDSFASINYIMQTSEKTDRELFKCSQEAFQGERKSLKLNSIKTPTLRKKFSNNIKKIIYPFDQSNKQNNSQLRQKENLVLINHNNQYSLLLLKRQKIKAKNWQKKKEKESHSIFAKSFCIPEHEEEYSSSAKLKAHLRDLCSQKEIDLMIEENEKFQPYRKDKDKRIKNNLFQQNKHLRGYDWHSNFTPVYNRNLYKRQAKIKSQMKNDPTIKYSQPQRTSIHMHYHKCKLLPKIQAQHNMSNISVSSNTVPIHSKHKKVHSQKWKTPTKDENQTFLEPLMNLRNKRCNYSISIEYLPQANICHLNHKSPSAHTNGLTNQHSATPETSPSDQAIQPF